ncbi:uncharacterized protein LOC142468854 [Ascaphus truei]|uniref:uncharacterized protein LOC142468854 n=1 Tax=Ascaphus truei TaxID=8439 RepID=UPI003F5A1EF4
MAELRASPDITQESDLSDTETAAHLQQAQAGARPKRTVTLTQKGREKYESDIEAHRAKLELAWETTTLGIRNVTSIGNYAQQLEQAITQLRADHSRYQELSEAYVTYLTRANTSESLQERDLQSNIDLARHSRVRTTITEAESRRKDLLLETASQRSSASRHSSRSARSVQSHASSASASATKARATAEAARARAEYGRREAAVRAERAKLDADLEALNQEKEAAAAIAQAEVLEAAARQDGGELPYRRIASEDPAQRTEDYVRSLFSVNTSAPSQHGGSDTTDNEDSLGPRGEDVAPSMAHAAWDSHSRNSDPHARAHTDAPQQARNPGTPTREKTAPHTGQQPSRVHAKEEATARTVPATTSERGKRADVSGLTDIAKYMIRRDLVHAGLISFDDRPENYRTWKFTFKDAIDSLDFSAREELNLLVKFLGNVSREQAQRLRTANAHQPQVGLDLVWERLEETYGSPEAVEDSLFKRIESFPKITSKDYSKLRDLGDLLQELESARKDHSLIGLNALDSARGVRPILEKLPFNLQERWLSQGSKYKREKQVVFPPFSFFVSFICEAAKTRNDPSFILGAQTTYSASSPKNERPATRYGNPQIPISARRTDVPPTAQTTPDQSVAGDKEPRDPNRECPIHKKPHPLNKCFGFRMKSLEERKRLLGEFGVCFKCCGSTTHLARDCKEEIKCTVCESDKHVTALHPEAMTLHQLKNPSSIAEHGGEKEEGEPTSVTSQRTEVCGKEGDKMSCSKICLVAVHPQGQPEKAIRMYAILDDQSNRSLVRSEFFDMFNIQDGAFPYTLRTCAGQMETTGRRVNGYTICSIDGKVNMPLPTLIECNHMTTNRDEIPTPDVALHYPHLKGIANHIRPVEQDAKILLLLGRDIMRVHKVRKQHNGPHNAPYAQRLDLGWVIVGNSCTNREHGQDYVDARRTEVTECGHTSLSEPCLGHLQVTEGPSEEERQGHTPETNKDILTPMGCDNGLGCSAVQTAKDDESTPPKEESNLPKVTDKGIVLKTTNNQTILPRARAQLRRTVVPLHRVSSNRATNCHGWHSRKRLRPTGEATVSKGLFVQTRKRGQLQRHFPKGFTRTKETVLRHVQGENNLPMAVNKETQKRFTKLRGDVLVQEKCTDELRCTAFQTTRNDDKQTPSREDRGFPKLTVKELSKDGLSSRVTPLPFRSPRRRFPNNGEHAISRLTSHLCGLQREPETNNNFVVFIQKIFFTGHEKPAPLMEEGKECRYLQSPGAYHPQEPDQIRVMFNPSAQLQGVSLNHAPFIGLHSTTSFPGTVIRSHKEPKPSPSAKRQVIERQTTTAGIPTRGYTLWVKLQRQKDCSLTRLKGNSARDFYTKTLWCNQQTWSCASTLHPLPKNLGQGTLIPVIPAGVTSLCGHGLLHCLRM